MTYPIIIKSRIYLVHPDNDDFSNANIRIEEMTREDNSKRYEVILINQYDRAEIWASVNKKNMCARMLQEIGRYTLQGWLLKENTGIANYYWIT